jgi:hypothetical protein
MTFSGIPAGLHLGHELFRQRGRLFQKNEAIDSPLMKSYEIVRVSY